MTNYKAHRFSTVELLAQEYPNLAEQINKISWLKTAIEYTVFPTVEDFINYHIEEHVPFLGDVQSTYIRNHPLTPNPFRFVNLDDYFDELVNEYNQDSIVVDEARRQTCLIFQ